MEECSLLTKRNQWMFLKTKDADGNTEWQPLITKYSPPPVDYKSTACKKKKKMLNTLNDFTPCLKLHQFIVDIFSRSVCSNCINLCKCGGGAQYQVSQSWICFGFSNRWFREPLFNLLCVICAAVAVTYAAVHMAAWCSNLLHLLNDNAEL